MKRDMDLIAKILAEVESFPAYGGHVSADGYPDEVVEYHLVLLAASGYIRHASKRHVEGLTWKGHDLCEEQNKISLAEEIAANPTVR